MLDSETNGRIKDIIRCFETGTRSHKSYARWALLSDGAGLSYGSEMSTDGSDTTDLICKRYIALCGPVNLDAYLPYLEKDATTKLNPKTPLKDQPEWFRNLVAKLELAGKDPVMQRAQDEIFDEQYFQPAVKIWNEAGLTSALALAIIYDTCIHSGPGRVATIRGMFPNMPPAKNNTLGAEERWCQAYVEARQEWLLSRSNPIIWKTIYRTKFFAEQIDAGNWNLKRAFTLMGNKFEAL